MATQLSPAAGSSSGGRRVWTRDEDARLVALVGRFGTARGRHSRWKEIAAGLPHRTAKDCRKRWFHSLDPSLRKGRWTAEEDQTLLQAYAVHGPAWYIIASMIPGRKDDQCAKRYNDILDPTACDRLRNWSPQEDQVLCREVRRLGNRWSAISRLIPGRPPLTCRNRWRALSRGRGGESAAAASDPSVADTLSESTTSRSASGPSTTETDAAVDAAVDAEADAEMDAEVDAEADEQSGPPWPDSSYLPFDLPDHTSLFDSLSSGFSPGAVPSSGVVSSQVAGRIHDASVDDPARAAFHRSWDIGGLGADSRDPSLAGTSSGYAALDHMLGVGSVDLLASPAPLGVDGPEATSTSSSTRPMDSHRRARCNPSRHTIQMQSEAERGLGPPPPHTNGELHIHHHVYHHHHHYHHYYPNSDGIGPSTR